MSHGRDTAPKRYGVVASFRTPEELLAAANRTREAGYRKIDGFSPIPVEGLTDVLKFDESILGWITFGHGVLGACIGVGLQWWTSNFAYSHNVGGKPLSSWPMFFPVTYECTILLAAFGATFGMIALNGLPKPHQPIFNAEAMVRASQDRFVLLVEASDPNFDETKVKAFMQTLDPESVEAVWTSEGY
ncbi:MAG: DUF3341 domain-containing protein [Fimbriimonadaceae bacterium]|nr:DUF3341 domain-containing protein [Fimbriimonadaceae bacterium]QYK58093.1 MAG: DUF3341 domain-containing protein [Fimbriimonadaceae bacterium]